MSPFTRIFVLGLLAVCHNHLQAQSLQCYDCFGSHIVQFGPIDCEDICSIELCTDLSDKCGSRETVDSGIKSMSYNCYSVSDCSQPGFECCSGDLCNPTGSGNCPSPSPSSIVSVTTTPISTPLATPICNPTRSGDCPSPSPSSIVNVTATPISTPISTPLATPILTTPLPTSTSCAALGILGGMLSVILWSSVGIYVARLI